jgi:hexosaminidase
MGGDEAPHNFWEKNPSIKALMQREGLKTMEEVQGYFTRRLKRSYSLKAKSLLAGMKFWKAIHPNLRP